MNWTGRIWDHYQLALPRVIRFLCVLCVLLSSAYANEETQPSFMLSPEEQEVLQQALGLKKHEVLLQDPETLKHVNLFLSAIMFFHPDKWTLWINDQIVGPKNSFPGVFVKDVSADEIIISTEESPNHLVSLKPNQSYVVDESRVVEGDVRTTRPLVPLDHALALQTRP